MMCEQCQTHCKAKFLYLIYYISYCHYFASVAVLILHFDYLLWNHIGGVMVSVLTSSALDRRFDPWSGQTMMKMSTLFYTNALSWIFIVLAH
jgi:hypothetical protein